MTTKLNAQALANTAREVARYATSACWTIKALVLHWNLCVQQSGFNGVYDIPGNYTRKAQIIADMERMAEQLDNIANNCDALTGRSMDVEEAHAEALAFNREHTAALVALSCDGFRSHWGTHTPHNEAMSVIYCHEQALALNDRYDAETAQWAFDMADKEGREIVIDYAHSEALEIDAAFTDSLPEFSKPELQRFWPAHTENLKALILNVAHSEALEINAEVDRRRTRRAEFFELTAEQQRRIINSDHDAATEEQLARNWQRNFYSLCQADRNIWVYRDHHVALEWDAGRDLKAINAELNRENSSQLGKLERVLLVACGMTDEQIAFNKNVIKSNQARIVELKAELKNPRLHNHAARHLAIENLESQIKDAENRLGRRA